MLITKFDPWRSKLCTCPPKLSLNPYTGCEHRCVYCYASSYIPNFFACRPKKNFLSRLKKESQELNGELISISNSSDPYPSIEKQLKLTRASLKILSTKNCKVQIITKSPLVVRDLNILKSMRAMVAMTITTESDKLCRRLEPYASPASERIKVAKVLIENGIPVAIRVDPIIPYLNHEQERLIKKLAEIGVRHIITSTYKVKPDNWQRFTLAFPKIAKKLKDLYFKEGERIGRSFCLPAQLRYKLISEIKKLAEENEMKFSCCREGFPQLNSAVCDGSWLINF